MNKYILGIDGMRCGMCELHIGETIAKAIWVKKVKASRFKKTSEGHDHYGVWSFIFGFVIMLILDCISL